MTIDFRRMMTPQAAARMDHQAVETRRLHGLPTRFLAREVLRLARALRDEHPDLTVLDRERMTYNSTMAWDVLPGLARRLGDASLRPDEDRSAELSLQSDAEFRLTAASYLRNCGFRQRAGRRAQDDLLASASEMVDAEPCNGNVVAIALDRLCPPGDEPAKEDWVAMEVMRVAAMRGHGHVTQWSPALADRKKANAGT